MTVLKMEATRHVPGLTEEHVFCEECGSANIEVMNAYATWNVEKQMWEVYEWEGSWCNECEENVELDSRFYYKRPPE